MRCLVLGGSGFIGRHAAKALAQESVEVVVGDISPSRDWPFAKVDFTDERSLSQNLKGVDVAVHSAWTTVPQSATNDPSSDVTTNVLGSLKLFEACVAQGVRRVVFCSSGGTVYGSPHSLPISEAHPLSPLSSYGITKLTVERYLVLFARLYGLEYTVLRPGNAYGEGQPNARGQGVIAACLAAVEADRPFVVWGDGTVVRDYVYVSDIARAVSLAATSEASNRILNVGTGRGVSISELVDIISKTTGRSVKIQYEAHRLIDVPANVLDSSLAKEVLNWNHQIPLEEGVLRQWHALRRPGR